MVDPVQRGRHVKVPDSRLVGSAVEAVLSSMVQRVALDQRLHAEFILQAGNSLGCLFVMQPLFYQICKLKSVGIKFELSLIVRFYLSEGDPLG